MPATLAEAIRAIVGEYETRESAEAVCASDADKLQCLIHGIEYRDQGYAHAQRRIDNSRRRMRTASAEAIADKLLETDGLQWLRTALGEG